jgi:hypothetical protein
VRTGFRPGSSLGQAFAGKRSGRANPRIARPSIEMAQSRRIPAAFSLRAEYERQLGGGSPLSSLMAVKD